MERFDESTLNMFSFLFPLLLTYYYTVLYSQIKIELFKCRPAMIPFSDADSHRRRPFDVTEKEDFAANLLIR